MGKRKALFCLPCSSPSSSVSTTLLFVFLLTPVAAQSPAAPHLGNVTDLAALLAFRSQADPAGVLSTWTARGGSADFCRSWAGVACSSRRQRLTGLSLSSISLSGTISPQIGDLSFLVFLDLSNNSLSGLLPGASLARLRRLQYLNLSANLFTGSIPAELGNLPMLADVRLGENRFSGQIPPSLGRLLRLRSLRLQSNTNLSGSIPEVLGRLPDLSYIDLRQNQLTGDIPLVILRMQSLRVLAVDNNLLSGEIPEDLHLPNVTYLSVSGNRLGGRIPRSVGRLSTLQSLILSKNPFTGQIPEELGSLSRLENLALDFTGISGTIPASLGNLTKLRQLGMEGAKIRGDIPGELGKLGSLTTLILASNMLTGRFPAAVYNMSSLSTLVLSSNSFSGNLPGDIGRRLPPSLQELSISYNMFAGEIPASLSNASMLSRLELSSNNFSGTVPRELGALQQLTFLNLGFNWLTGTLDYFLGDLTGCRQLGELNLMVNFFSGNLPAGPIGNFSNTKLYRFVADYNYLEGSIPATFGNFTSFQTLSMADNAFSGPIPPEVVSLNGLQRLYLQQNQLQGMPAAIGAAKNLGLLYLQSNNLSGAIPASIGNLSKLTELDLGQNSLQSTLPPGLWNLSALFRLNVAQNRLVGQLPDTIDGLSNLMYLNFSGNQFSGGIPAATGKLQMLQDLRMANNNFSGPIPSTLDSLKGLAVLDLSSNSLSGTIPPSIAGLRTLERLNLSYNKLEGEIPGDGIFAAAAAGISGESFAGNLALCGAPWFGLPSCGAAHPGHGHKRRRLIIIIVSAAAATLLLLLLLAGVVLVRRRRKKRNRTPPDALPEVVPGHPTISRHELVRATGGFSDANLLGAGSYGKVYRGRLKDGTAVAVKVLDLEMGEAAWRSFDAECRVMRAVRHRNLLSVITTCSSPDFRSLVMPLMPNGSLDTWLHGTGGGDGLTLSLPQRVEMAADVAAALEYLHHGCSEPVVHCDLKPSNVLFDAQMVAHIGDFGISKVVAEHSRSATRTGMPGTFGYMAPEYGTVGRVTTMGDVYSYGILLLEALTGVRPTDAKFSGDVNLRAWVAASAYRGAAAEIVPSSLLRIQPEESSVGGGGGGDGGTGAENERCEDCVVAVLELGLTCSSESPRERPDMVAVAAEMKKIRATCCRECRASWTEVKDKITE